MSTEHISKTVMLAGVVGNALEWYDFLLYAYFASVIAPLFFPAKTPFVSLLLTFGVFALGFLVRPLGGLIIGRFGDVYGRKKALIFTIWLMTVPTVLIGLLPSYATIGIAAPIILTLIRCLQGFAVSGELTSSANFLVEHAHPQQRGFAGSLIMAGAFTGILFGSLIVTLQTEWMPADILHSWGWRIPFLLAGVFGVIGLIIRLRAMESPQFMALQGGATKTPLNTWIKDYWKPWLYGLGRTVVLAIGNYFFIAYFATFLVKQGGFTLNEAMVINVISTAIFVIALPFIWFIIG